MGTITTSIVDNGALRNWDIPVGVTLAPRGEIVFAGFQTIAAKINTDISILSLQMNFPRNFVYKLTDLTFSAFAPAAIDLDDWARGLRIFVSADIGGISSAFTDNFAMYSAISLYDTVNSFPFSDATNVVMASFVVPGGAPQYFIDATNAARMVWSWMDGSGDATPAVQIFWRARALQYDIAQLDNYLIHTPIRGLTG